MTGLTKYDWGTACRFFPGFRDSPGVIRLAWELVDLYDEALGCAFPSREGLSQRLDCSPISVSKWIATLRSGGAISCLRLGILPPEVRAEIGRTTRRAQAYALKFGWALDVLALRDERILERRESFKQKVAATEPSEPKGSTESTSEGSANGTFEGSAHGTQTLYENTLGDTLERKGASEREELGVYERAKEPSSPRSYRDQSGGW